MMLVDSLPFLMLGALAILLSSGLPVAFILSGIGVAVCLIGIALDEMPWAALYSIVPKMVYAVSGTPFYPAVVMLLFMGVALEKSGIAQDMLARSASLCRQRCHCFFYQVSFKCRLAACLWPLSFRARS